MWSKDAHQINRYHIPLESNFFDFQRSFLFPKTLHFPPFLRKKPLSEILHLQVKKMICCPPRQIPQLNPWLPQVTKVKSGCAWRISARCRSLKVACATAKGRTGRPSFQASGGWFYNRNGDSKLTAVKTTVGAITFTWRWPTTPESPEISKHHPFLTKLCGEASLV